MRKRLSQEQLEAVRRKREERRAKFGASANKRAEEPNAEGSDFQDYSTRINFMKPRPRYEGGWDE